MTDLVTIGIVDSGVVKDDDILSPMISKEATFECDRCCQSAVVDAESEDESGHGTFCARIIAAIAPAVRFHVAKVLNAKDRGYGTGLVSALNWLAEDRVDVINLSLGTRSAAYLEALIEVVNRLNAQNTVLVAAGLCQLLYPASIPSVLSVIRRGLYESIRKDAVQALKIDFAVEFDGATGLSNIAVDESGHHRDYASSFAAPYVTGLVALMRNECRGATWSQVRGILSMMTDDGTLLNSRDNPFLRKVIVQHEFRRDELRTHLGC